MKRLILLAFSALALVAAGCGGGGTAALGSGDVAVIGSQHITKQQFQDLMARAEKSYKQSKRPFPKAGTPEYEQLKGQAVGFLLRRAEYDQKAAGMGIHVSSDQVRARIAKDKKQYFGGSEKRFLAYLTQQGLTEAGAPEEWKAKIISEEIFKKITTNVSVSGTAVKAYYDTHKSQYVQPDRRDVRHILVLKKALADQLYAQLKAGANFAKLAKKYSKDPGSAPNGGKLTVSKGQTVPEFDKTAFSLKKGELSKPVHTRYGYHIIQALSDIKPASKTPFDTVKASIKQQLEQQQKTDQVTKWDESTRKYYCGDTRIKYQVGYQPSPDPCATLTASTTQTTH
jgi:parvulin-like peptidyl-prolyl isomerase